MPRLFCGKICPYGYLQGLIHKIPFPKKVRTFKGDKVLRHLKFAVLLAWLVGNTLGLFGERAINAPLVIGLVVFVLLCILTSRPFCKYLCPVGAVLGLSNLLPWGRYKVNSDSCTKCCACSRVCKMDIEPYKTPNSIECIRCGKCKKKCPANAIM
jgi:polyferredoxin